MGRRAAGPAAAGRAHVAHGDRRATPPSGSRTGLIIGIVIAALAVIGVAAFFLTRDGDDESVTGDSGAAVRGRRSDEPRRWRPTTPSTTAAESTSPSPTVTSPAPIRAHAAPTRPAPERGGEIPPPTEEPDGLGDDAELNALANDCYDGDMQACDDLLYDRSEARIGLRALRRHVRRPPAGGHVVYCTVTFPGRGRRRPSPERAPGQAVGSNPAWASSIASSAPARARS